MSHERTVDASPSHVDLDVIMAVLRDHPDSVVECRIAFALILAPDQRGVRALERSAGVAFNSVLDTLSSESWGLSPHGLVQTIERGKSWDSEGREVSLYRLAELGRERVTKGLISKKALTSGQEPLEKFQETKTDGDSLAHRFSRPELKALLDPSLDLWAREGKHLGPEVWRVAMLTGMATVELSAKEWAELAGGSDRAKRLAKKLTAYGWGLLAKTGKARATRYVLDWSGLLDERHMDTLVDLRTREGKLMLQHAEEQRRITEPLTAEEIRATKGEQMAKALLDELDGTETAEHRADVEKLAELFRGATVADWMRWTERENAVRV